jgi:hypothetical protein
VAGKEYFICGIPYIINYKLLKYYEIHNISIITSTGRQG